MPFQAGIFDLVICTEVTEHTLQTEETLSEISRLLKPGGQCLLSFPVKSIENIITKFSGSFLAYSGHVRQFGLDEMKNLLLKHGLETIKVYRRYFEWSFYWLLRALIGQVPAADRRGDQYGVDVPDDQKWEKITYYYKRLWARAVQWKIGIPLLWLGNQIFPKSYILICRKIAI